MDQEQRAQVIAGVGAFSGLEADHLQSLAGIFSERQCTAGEILINEGDRGKKLSIVVDGAIKVLLPAGGPKQRLEELELAVLREGDVFGEYSFIDLRPASATVVALEPTTLLEVEHDELHRLLGEYCPAGRQVYYNLLLVLIDRLRADDQDLDAFTNSWT